MPARVSTPWVCQAAEGRASVLAGLHHFFGERYLCGPAVTFACAENDNLALHQALHQALPGSVLIGHGGGTVGAALFGELMATDALGHGLAGLVVEGPVRDVLDLDRLGFPVVCSAVSPPQCRKQRVVSVQQPVAVGGVEVHPGDQVVADPDGCVVVAQEHWPAVRDRALAIRDHEITVVNRLQAGERLWDVLGLGGR